MNRIKLGLAFATMLAAAGLAACADGMGGSPSADRSGSYTGPASIPDDRGLQARNASPYMRQ